MSAELDRDQRVTLIADALRIARERGLRDWALGVVEATEAWLATQANGDPEIECAVRLLRVALGE